MKKSLTRKLTIAVIALVFAVVSLSTSTYAWFTMSNTAQIDGFTADVKAGEGIEIAITSKGTQNEINAAKWYTGNVPADVVKTAFEANGFTKFQDLTTTESGKTFKYIDKTTGALTDYNETTELGYVSFNVHIKTAVVGNVVLDGITLESTPKANTSPWTVDAGYDIAENNTISIGTEVEYLVEDAARIAIIYNNNSTVYEKGAAEGFTTENQDYSGNTKGTQSVYGAYSYYNSKNENGVQIDIANAQNCNYNTNEIAATGLDVNKFPATEGGIISFEVKIWIEGWDAECINAIFSQTLTTELHFSFEE